jgi:hypothetical protein
MISSTFPRAAAIVSKVVKRTSTDARARSATVLTELPPAIVPTLTVWPCS